MTLVFDNHQTIAKASVMQEILRIGLSELPKGLTAIVISRTGSPGALVRLQTEQQIEVIAEEALRLTSEETKQLVRLQVHETGRSHTADEVARLYQTTKGWVAGLILLLEHAKQYPLGTALAGLGAMPGLCVPAMSARKRLCLNQALWPCWV